MTALASLTKFAPLVLGPLMLRGVGQWPRPSRIALYVGGFAAAIAAAMAPVVLSGDWHYFWRDTIVYQFDRPAPFSIWGLWGGAQISPPSSLQPIQRIAEAATVLFGISVMFFPRGERSLLQVAALAAALVICVQLCLAYWFYLYIPWFFAPAIVALAGFHPFVTSGGDPDPEPFRAPSAVPATV